MNKKEQHRLVEETLAKLNRLNPKQSQQMGTDANLEMLNYHVSQWLHAIYQKHNDLCPYVPAMEQTPEAEQNRFHKLMVASTIAIECMRTGAKFFTLSIPVIKPGVYGQDVFMSVDKIVEYLGLYKFLD